MARKTQQTILLNSEVQVQLIVFKLLIPYQHERALIDNQNDKDQSLFVPVSTYHCPCFRRLVNLDTQNIRDVHNRGYLSSYDLSYEADDDDGGGVVVTLDAAEDASH